LYSTVPLPLVDVAVVDLALDVWVFLVFVCFSVETAAVSPDNISERAADSFDNADVGDTSALF
jgi:hypothetical protein